MSHANSVSGFGEVLLFIIGGLLFVTVSLTVARLVRPHRPSAAKLASYETGEESTGSAWTQFNVRFYIIALIFLLFEVELVFLFPWATVFGNKVLNQATNQTWAWFALVEMMLFVLILAIGLAYAWGNGYLDWIKPKATPNAFSSKVPPNLYEHINQKYSDKV